MTDPFLSIVGSTRFTERKVSRELKERAIATVLFLAALVSVATTVAIMWILISESIQLFQHVSLWEFLTGTEWAPLFEPPRYGILPLVCGTLVTSGVALFVAVPMGTIAALYLTEFASPRLREAVKPILELLAGIPTVVYGYFALLFVTPLLQLLLPELPGFNMLSPGLVMGIMITPLISSISEDAMRAVPLELREGSYAAGATRFQTAWKVVFPAAISGISASYILGISRAVGETMIVAIAAGLQPIITLNPLDSAATITAYIVQVSLGDIPHGTPEYQTIFAAGLTLVVITLIFNIIGYFLSRHYREKY
ncbi:phosphate ABC transporter permease subunit PstC [Leptothermofonsia sichuanensis E412]|uniref:phosphate ABC transporter permease subunit PstC n=1 Tax=Leptothermofonsia sichuanensis TaxID=2917832 RepID=UPI001CA765BD|nr:phosphate ABC transporter permease subunit PstC [Leptothermofonsia sichuanensis]QZZ21673.1 phosphate ABC transporter permease subunit PstC [Leptothermofonsia sichuanensis E412]